MCCHRLLSCTLLRAPFLSVGVGDDTLWSVLPLLFCTAVCLPCMHFVGVVIVIVVQCLCHGFLRV